MNWEVAIRMLRVAAIVLVAIGAVVAVLVHGRARRNLLWRVVSRLTLEPWRAIDADGGPADPRVTDAGRTAWQVGAVLVGASLTLTLQEYLGPRGGYEWFAYDAEVPGRHGSLDGFAWWTLWSAFGYALVPLAILAVVPGLRVRDVLGPRDPRRQLGLYAGALILGLALGWLAARAGWVAERSPLARSAAYTSAERARWWALAAVQIVAVELFFRGYLLEGLRRVAGANAIFIALVPYCMIHYGKVFEEPLLVIGSGLILGTVAMRLRSIWAGVALQLGLAAIADPSSYGRVRLAVDWAALGQIAPRLALGLVVLAAIVGLLIWSRARANWFWRAVAALSVRQWRAIDEDGGPAAAGARDAGRVDWKVGVILAVVCVSLTLQEYVGQRAQYEAWFPFDPADPDPYWSLKGFAWWTGWRVFGYLLLPMAVIAALPGERIRDYHVSPRGFVKHLWIYGVMFALILPAVYVASTTATFRHTYPFYRLANRSAADLWIWEAMYAVQFLSLEFFFRGFMLQGLRRALGSNAVFVMIVPYCMIHYGKPMAETCGAIGAGLILGTLAMRTRSIWGGVVIHVGVAWTMDLLAIGHCPTDGRPCR